MKRILALMFVLAFSNTALATTQALTDAAADAALAALQANSQKSVDSTTKVQEAANKITTVLAEVRPGCSDPVELLKGDLCILIAFELLNGNGNANFCDYATHANDQGVTVHGQGLALLNAAFDAHEPLENRAEDWDFTNDPTAAEWSAVIAKYNAAKAKLELSTTWFTMSVNYSNSSIGQATQAQSHYQAGFVPGGPGPANPLTLP